MKGFVETPKELVDLMVEKLFRDAPPVEGSTLLDPGCGRGAFIEGVIRWCRRYHKPIPQITGIELNPKHVQEAKKKFDSYIEVKIIEGDFLTYKWDEKYGYIIGNPPYVPITNLSREEKARYRRLYKTASGRFDLYLLFFEKALGHLKPDGRLVLITPEKYTYVNTAKPLRLLLKKFYVEEIHMVNERSFGSIVAYPTITTVVNRRDGRTTRIVTRDDVVKDVILSIDGSQWTHLIFGGGEVSYGLKLSDICIRISCGVATGADSVFVVETKKLEEGLKKFAYPTISGKELRPGEMPEPKYSMLVPYTRDGRLIPEKKLGKLGEYLRRPNNYRKLKARSCVARKPWYAFHETPPMRYILRPKIMCKDITSKPFFVVDETGEIIPRHSVYYIVPKDPLILHELASYLNSPEVSEWLISYCQRAANGFLRLQSHILKNIPVPEDLLKKSLTTPRVDAIEVMANANPL
ncbi:Eco57I restriction-modification methylase domain-containing protein [Candidatus Pyrohabitans sp.]